MLLRYIPGQGKVINHAAKRLKTNSINEEVMGDTETSEASSPSKCAEDSKAVSNEILLVDRYRLTAREAEVLHLLSLGLNRPAIAQKLVISDNTVRTHMKSIYRKLDVHTQQQLINLVHEGDMR